MLFGGQTGQRKEDVGVVGGTFFDRPVLHGRGHDVGDRRIELFARLDRSHQGLEDRLGKPIFHHRLVENVGAKQLLRRCLHKVQRGCWGSVIGHRRNRRHAGGLTRRYPASRCPCRHRAIGTRLSLKCCAHNTFTLPRVKTIQGQTPRIASPLCLEKRASLLHAMPRSLGSQADGEQITCLAQQPQQNWRFCAATSRECSV